MLMQKSAEFGINLNAKDNISGRTAFHLACAFGKTEIARMIVQKSTELNIELNNKNRYGWTAFQLASNHGRVDIVDMMIENAKYYQLALIL